MKFSEEGKDSGNLITSYGSGFISVNGNELNSAIVLAENLLVSDWKAQTLDDVQAEELEALMTELPELLVLGSGPGFKMPDRYFQIHFLQRGVGCEVMDSAAACRTYNVLRSERRNVMAAILLP